MGAKKSGNQYTMAGFKKCKPRCLGNLKRCSHNQKCATRRNSNTNRCRMIKHCAKRTAAKRTAAKRPAAKRPAAKRTAAKRPAAKRTAAKRPAVASNEFACVKPYNRSTASKDERQNACVRGAIPRQGYENLARTRQECTNSCFRS